MGSLMMFLPYLVLINVLLAVLALLTKGGVGALFKMLTLGLFIATVIIAVGYLARGWIESI